MNHAMMIVLIILGGLNLFVGAFRAFMETGLGWAHYQLAVGGLILGAVGATIF